MADRRPAFPDRRERADPCLSIARRARRRFLSFAGSPGVAAVVVLCTAAVAQAQSEPPVGESAVPGSHRLFFIPTGRTLPEGTGEVGAYQIIGAYAGYAFHDRVMISGGTPILPEIFGRFWYLAPKVGLLALPRWHAAVGGLLLFETGDPFDAGGDDEIQLLNPFLWGVVTYGGSRAALTAGVTSDVGRFTEVGDDAVLLLGGELELVRRGTPPARTAARLIAESYLNWPFDGGSAFDPSVTVVGIRVSDGRAAFEVAALVTAEGGEVDVANLPLIHVSVLF